MTLGTHVAFAAVLYLGGATRFGDQPDGIGWALAERRRMRGSQKAPTKEQVAIRLSPEVLAYFRATGQGWQTRMNAALKEWIAQHSG